MNNGTDKPQIKTKATKPQIILDPAERVHEYYIYLMETEGEDNKQILRNYRKAMNKLKHTLDPYTITTVYKKWYEIASVDDAFKRWLYEKYNRRNPHQVATSEQNLANLSASNNKGDTKYK